MNYYMSVYVGEKDGLLVGKTGSESDLSGVLHYVCLFL